MYTFELFSEASSAGTNTSKLYTEAGQRAGQRAKERRGASGMVMQAGQIEAADMVGYMPLRAEYDSEWENEASSTLTSNSNSRARPSLRRHALFVSSASGSCRRSS